MNFNMSVLFSVTGEDTRTMTASATVVATAFMATLLSFFV
jgi:uncharacterized lipoprotein YajG